MVLKGQYHFLIGGLGTDDIVGTFQNTALTTNPHAPQPLEENPNRHLHIVLLNNELNPFSLKIQGFMSPCSCKNESHSSSAFEARSRTGPSG